MTNKVKFIKFEKLGSGTFSTVYKAKDTDNETNEYVAYKKYIEYHDLTNGVYETVLREICILKMCDHPNIVKIHWYDNIKFKCFSMKLYENHLNQYINRYYGMLTTDIIRNISYQLLQGLYYLHSYGIAHRDLKPQNIMVDISINDNTIKNIVIVDMGLGRQFDIHNRKCTKTMDVCTLWYRSPDVLLGYDDYNYDLDIWSLGCIISEMMTKTPLFPGNSEIGQLYLIFQLLGTPNNETWKGVSSLPDFKPGFPQYKSTFYEQYKSTDYDPDLLELIKFILILNPEERPNISTILKHPFYYFNNKNNNNNQNDDEIVDVKEKWIENMMNWKIFPIHNSIVNQKQNIKKYRMFLLDWLLAMADEYSLSSNRKSVV